MISSPWLQRLIISHPSKCWPPSKPSKYAQVTIIFTSELAAHQLFKRINAIINICYFVAYGQRIVHPTGLKTLRQFGNVQ